MEGNVGLAGGKRTADGCGL
jgi:hypothetical protein